MEPAPAGKSHRTQKVPAAKMKNLIVPTLEPALATCTCLGNALLLVMCKVIIGTAGITRLEADGLG